MEIATIKSRLSLSQVLSHYGLSPDKNKRLNCPFHNDRTPSMQVYYDTNTVYCFSSNCQTHGSSLDVIDFIMYKESCSKHEAILKAKLMLGVVSEPKEMSRTTLLSRVFSYFKNSVLNSKPAKAYLAKRFLDSGKTEVGYNSGQFHHGKRKEVSLIQSCVKYGLLLHQKGKSRTGDATYSVFGKWCICFALRDSAGEISGLYFRSTLDDKAQRHFYLKDRKGLYPKYPSKGVRRLILTESIIDAATLLEQAGIKEGYEVLALYGTNGLTAEHEKAIKNLKELEEVIFFLNGDEAGKKAVEKYAAMLRGDYSDLVISRVEVPDGEDVNSLLQGHEASILSHLIERRVAYDLLFSTENQVEAKQEHYPTPSLFTPTEEDRTQALKSLVQQSQGVPVAQSVLDTSQPHNIKYQGDGAAYSIKGFKLSGLDSLKITLQIELI